MKRLVVFMAMMFIAVLSMNAQVNPTAAAPQDSIVFTSTVHDYGTIVQGADGSCEFVFVNKGKSPLVLNDVKASCGCTVPEWTRTPVAPGTKGSIKVTYNTNNVGAFTKTITVNSNAVNNPLVLIIRGTVNAKQ